MRPPRFDVLEGGAVEVLRRLPAGSAQACVTSPPYFRLRDYDEPGQIGLEGTPEAYVARLVGVFREVRRVLRDDGTLWLNLGSTYFDGDSYPLREIDAAWLAAIIDGEGCIQIHQQKHPRNIACVDSFQVDVGVGMMTPEVVQRCHELTGLGSCKQQNRGVWDWSVRGRQAARMLRAIYPYLLTKRRQAALAIMLAEDLAERKYGRGRPADPAVIAWRADVRRAVSDCNQRRNPAMEIREPTPLPLNLKPKDDIGIPWKVADALRADGWYLRKAIVWHKPNPTPESVRDRPTSSHEHVFLLSKQPTYHYDAVGYREKAVSGHPSGNGFRRPQSISHNGRGARGSDRQWEVADERNARDVWTIPTVPFPDAHFAVFPPELPRRCILLGTSPRACPDCGAPWRRRVERQRLLDGEPVTGSWADETGRRLGAQGVGHARFTTQVRTLGWHPTCPCGAPDAVQPHDLDEILSPIARPGTPDPTLKVGRAGLARPRAGDGGSRAMTRWEQRHLAAQLASSPHRGAMSAEAGADAFTHYLRTDRGGSCPRAALLDRWRELGWLDATPPVPSAWWCDEDAGRCLVIDPFAGAGTTGLVAIDEGRDFLGVELSPTYAAMARRRISDTAMVPRLEMLD